MKTEIAMLASVSYWIDYFLPESTHAVLDCSIKQIVYQAWCIIPAFLVAKFLGFTQERDEISKLEFTFIS